MANEPAWAGTLNYSYIQPPLEQRPVVNFTRADGVDFRPTEWLIENWLVRNTLAGLVGPSTVGKSFMAIDWACTVATGRRWFGEDVHRGGVFYLAGEGRQGLRKRVAAWERYFETPIAGHPLYLADSLPFLCEPSQALGTVDAIDSLSDELLFNAGGAEPALVIIDTVARAMGGANENSAEHMGQLIRSMDWLRERWGATVLAVHHTGHGDADRARGSSAFRAALDSEFVMRPDGERVLLSATKAKDWKRPTNLMLRKVSVELDLVDTDGNPLRESSLVLQSDVQAVMEESSRKRAQQMRAAGKSYGDITRETGIPKATLSRMFKGADDGR